MKDEIGRPFAEIKGPGVWIVESLTELENKLTKLGYEVEYRVQKVDKTFKWPPQINL